MSQEIKFTISTYNSSDVLIESSVVTYSIAPIGVPFPSEYGFNLFEFATIRNLVPVKFSNDTFNELLINSASASTNIEINNITTGKQLYNTTTPGSSIGVKSLYFEKRFQNIWTSAIKTIHKPIDYTGVVTFSLGTYNYGELDNVIIEFDKTIFSDDGSTNNRDELIFSYTANPDETYTSTQQKDGNVNHIKLEAVPKNYGSGTVTVTLKIDNADAFLTTHIYVENIKAIGEFTPEYSDFILARGVNKLEIFHTTYALNRVFEIDHDPDGCYVNVLFSHPYLGYVTYPFEGMKIESDSNSNGDVIDVFNTSLVDTNKLSELQSITSNTNISLSSQVDKKYWDVLKEIFNARHVYLYIGDKGGLDDINNWTQCEISGGYNINYNKNKTSAIFTVNLALPDKFNNSL
jgi:hypothetical protein